MMCVIGRMQERLSLMPSTLNYSKKQWRIIAMKNEWHCGNDAPDSNAPIWCVDENGCIFTMRLCDAIKLYGSWSQFILAEPIEKWKYIAKINEEDNDKNRV